jgi:hypothetical protein
MKTTIHVTTTSAYKYYCAVNGKYEWETGNNGYN